MRGKLIEEERVSSIIAAFFTVYNYYGGYGLKESIYASALEIELMDRGHTVVRELLIPVEYKGRHVGWQRLDMVVDNAVIVENKATERLTIGDTKQPVRYLRVSRFEVALLLHFGPHPYFKKFIDYPKRRIG
jgi:GxxExxY protein